MKTNTSVASICWEAYEKEGIILDYSVTHIRRKLKGKTGNPTNINPKGGATVVSIMFSDCGLLTGKAECSDEDFFCKITGRTIAFLRIVDARNKIMSNRSKKEEKNKNVEWNKKVRDMKENGSISDPIDKRYCMKDKEITFWSMDEESTLSDPNDYTKFTNNQLMFGYADINSEQGKEIFKLLTKICNGDYNKK